MTDYVHQDYPKWVRTPDGKQQIAKNAMEELDMWKPFEENDSRPIATARALMKAAEESNPCVRTIDLFDDLLDCDKPAVVCDTPILVESVTPATPVMLNKDSFPEDKEELIALADSLGVIRDKRWGAPKLIDAIKKAQRVVSASYDEDKDDQESAA